MKKLVKILPVIMTVMMVFMAASPVLAGTVGGLTINPNTQQAASQLGETPNRILGIIQVVGTVIAVGVLMVLGIKYMMGSAQEKAEYKKTFIPYVIGAVLLFAAVNIANMVVNLASSVGQ